MKYLIITLLLSLNVGAKVLPKDVNEPTDFLTYADVQMVFVNNCASCHNAKTPERNWLDKKTAISKKQTMYKRVFIEGDMPVMFKYFSPFERATLKKWLLQDLKIDVTR